MAIAFPVKPEEDYCIIDKDGVEVEELYYDNDDDNQVKEKGKDKNVIGQFYFVKIQNNFVDPALKMRIENAKISINLLHKTKASLLNEIEDRKVNGPLYYRTALYENAYHYNPINHYPYKLYYLRSALRCGWPDSIDEDPEKAVDLEVEVEKIKKKIKELSYQLSHGTQKLDRIRKEMKDLQTKHDVLAKEVNEVVARTPPYSYDGSKYEIQRKMRVILQVIRKKNMNNSEMKEIKPRKGRSIDINQKLLAIDQEEDAIQKRITKTSPKLNEQATVFEDYVSTMKKAKEISANKNLVALAKLSSKQIDGFMDKWKNDEAFREKYKRSIEKSLIDRGLAKDGRML